MIDNLIRSIYHCILEVMVKIDNIHVSGTFGNSLLLIQELNFEFQARAF